MKHDELAAFLAGEEFDVSAPFINGVGMDCGASALSLGSCAGHGDIYPAVGGGFLEYTANGLKRVNFGEHRKHCKAKPGNCPYEKRAKKIDESDTLEAGNKTNNKYSPERKYEIKRDRNRIEADVLRDVTHGIGLKASEYERAAREEFENYGTYGENFIKWEAYRKLHSDMIQLIGEVMSRQGHYDEKARLESRR